MTLEAVSSVVVEAFGPDFEGVRADDDLQAGGLFQSLRVLELVLMLERRFGIVLSPVDIVPENFATVRAIAAMVESRQNDDGGG